MPPHTGKRNLLFWALLLIAVFFSLPALADTGPFTLEPPQPLVPMSVPTSLADYLSVFHSLSIDAVFFGQFKTDILIFILPFFIVAGFLTSVWMEYHIARLVFRAMKFDIGAHERRLFTNIFGITFITLSCFYVLTLLRVVGVIATIPIEAAIAIVEVFFYTRGIPGLSRWQRILPPVIANILAFLIGAILPPLALTILLIIGGIACIRRILKNRMPPRELFTSSMHPAIPPTVGLLLVLAYTVFLNSHFAWAHYWPFLPLEGDFS